MRVSKGQKLDGEEWGIPGCLIFFSLEITFLKINFFNTLLFKIEMLVASDF